MIIDFSITWISLTEPISPPSTGNSDSVVSQFPSAVFFHWLICSSQSKPTIQISLGLSK
jgi:hypothetical protein